MRALWIALLIALLPLRSWVGDAMAVGMLHVPPPAAHTAQAEATHGGGHEHPGDHASAHADTEAGTAAPHASHTPHADADGDHTADPAQTASHLLCDVCNGPVLSPAALAPPATPAAHPLRIERSERFASLAPRQDVKPPIA